MLQISAVLHAYDRYMLGDIDITELSLLIEHLRPTVPTGYGHLIPEGLKTALEAYYVASFIHAN